MKKPTLRAYGVRLDPKKVKLARERGVELSRLFRAALDTAINDIWLKSGSALAFSSPKKKRSR